MTSPPRVIEEGENSNAGLEGVTVTVEVVGCKREMVKPVAATPKVAVVSRVLVTEMGTVLRNT